MEATDVIDVTGLYRRPKGARIWTCIVCGKLLSGKRNGMSRVSHANMHVRDGRAVRLPGYEARFQPKEGS